MNYDCVIGIDPGMNGGIAIVSKNQVVTYKNTGARDLRGIISTLSKHTDIGNNPFCVLEKIQLYRGDMDVPGKIFGLQKLFNHYQLLRQAVDYVNIPYLLPHPATWQKNLNLKVKEPETDKDRKNRYKERAKVYFPETKVTLWNSDALLLTTFGLKMLTNHREWFINNLNY